MIPNIISGKPLSMILRYLLVFFLFDRDPAVFPLAIIIGGVICAAGYFAFNKAPKEGGGVESVGPRRETIKMK
jgi:hypothetical protein